MTKEILYNGQCPICSTEIGQYRRAADAAGAALCFTDLNRTDLGPWGLSADDAARRLHLRRPDGQFVPGLPAFVAIWTDLPRWRWLAWLVTRPGIFWLATRAYDHVAAPALFALHRHRQARGKGRQAP